VVLLLQNLSPAWAAGREIQPKEQWGGPQLGQVLLSPSRGEFLPFFHKTWLIPGVANPAASHQAGKKQTRVLPTPPSPHAHPCFPTSSPGRAVWGGHPVLGPAAIQSIFACTQPAKASGQGEDMVTAKPQAMHHSISVLSD